MRRQPIIQRFAALALLVLFAFSNTPKRYLHDWFADHKDVTVKLTGQSGGEQIHSQGISCDCDNLVATSPFTSDATVFSFVVPVLYGTPTAIQPVDIYNTDLLLNGLRGPPTLA